MIVGLRGEVRRVEAGAIVLGLGPVDVQIAVPSPVAQRATPGARLELATYLHVREDQLALFGFDNQAGLELFKLLLGVGGVGPKLALALLSTLPPGELARAIASGDTRLLSRAPGVGARAAARIVAELQSRLGELPLAVGAPAGSIAAATLEALVAMGYSPALARQAVDAVGGADSVEDGLRAALGFLASRAPER